IEVPIPFRNFEDYWSPFLGGQGPAPGFAMSLPEDRRIALRELIRCTLRTAPDGSIQLTARAWGAGGTKPERPTPPGCVLLPRAVAGLVGSGALAAAAKRGDDVTIGRAAGEPAVLVGRRRADRRRWRRGVGATAGTAVDAVLSHPGSRGLSPVGGEPPRAVRVGRQGGRRRRSRRLRRGAPPRGGFALAPRGAARPRGGIRGSVRASRRLV